MPLEASDNGTTFESLYRTHAKRIYSLAYRFAGNAAEAEELLLDIFLQACRKMSSFRQEAGCRPGCNGWPSTVVSITCEAGPHGRVRRRNRW